MLLSPAISFKSPKRILVHLYPEIDSCKELSFSSEESTLQWDVHSSEATLSRHEQMPGISKTRDLGMDSMFDVEASDQELPATSTLYTCFLREDDESN